MLLRGHFWSRRTDSESFRFPCGCQSIHFTVEAVYFVIKELLLFPCPNKTKHTSFCRVLGQLPPPSAGGRKRCGGGARAEGGTSAQVSVRTSFTKPPPARGCGCSRGRGQHVGAVSHHVSTSADLAATGSCLTDPPAIIRLKFSMDWRKVFKKQVLLLRKNSVFLKKKSV